LKRWNFRRSGEWIWKGVRRRGGGVVVAIAACAAVNTAAGIVRGVVVPQRYVGGIPPWLSLHPIHEKVENLRNGLQAKI